MHSAMFEITSSSSSVSVFLIIREEHINMTIKYIVSFAPVFDLKCKEVSLIYNIRVLVRNKAGVRECFAPVCPIDSSSAVYLRQARGCCDCLCIDLLPALTFSLKLLRSNTNIHKHLAIHTQTKAQFYITNQCRDSHTVLFCFQRLSWNRMSSYLASCIQIRQSDLLL